MIKKEIYPKTQRVKCDGEKLQITEKLDGSNLVIFNKNEELYIAQRNYIFKYDELEQNQDKIYKGLYQWLKDNKESLNLHDGSAICGEWIGMGCLKYNVDEFDKRYYLFARANVDDELNLYNLNYNHVQLKYSFIEEEIPKFIGIVPVITELTVLPNKEHLDSIYEKYSEKVNRKVEGFVLNYRNNISKYVRMKNGQLKEHFDRENK